MRLQCSFMHIFEENTLLSLQIQRHGPIIWVKPKRTLFDIYTLFYLPNFPSEIRDMGFIFFTIAIFTEMQIH